MLLRSCPSRWYSPRSQLRNLRCAVGNSCSVPSSQVTLTVQLPWVPIIFLYFMAPSLYWLDAQDAAFSLSLRGIRLAPWDIIAVRGLRIDQLHMQTAASLKETH